MTERWGEGRGFALSGWRNLCNAPTFPDSEKGVTCYGQYGDIPSLTGGDPDGAATIIRRGGLDGGGWACE